MSVEIEIARIAAESALIAAAIGSAGALLGTWAGALIGSRSAARTAQAASCDNRKLIEADRRRRIWEKQAETYTEAIAGIIHRQRVRGGMMQGVITGTEPERKAAPVDWLMLEAKLIAYAPNDIVAALETAGTAGQNFEVAVAMWKARGEQARGARPGIVIPRPPGERAAIKELLDEAGRLDDVLIDMIRRDLHADTDVEPAKPLSLAHAEQPDAGDADQLHHRLRG